MGAWNYRQNHNVDRNEKELTIPDAMDWGKNSI